MQIFSVYEWIITFDVFDSFGKRINNDKPLFLGPEKYLHRRLRLCSVSLKFFKLGGFRLTYWDLDVSSFFLSSHNLLLLPHA